jgi:chaperonin cofactor prefoldin
MRETLANAGTRATLVERNLMTDDVSINLNSYNGENKCDCIIEVKNKEDPPTTDDTVIQNLEDQIEQLNLTLAVFRTHQKQQTNEITNLRLGSANLRSQLIRQATSRAWYVSEYKNTRNQLIETNLSKMRNELSLAMEIIELKKKVTKLQGSREKAADILKRATKDSSLVEF